MTSWSTHNKQNEGIIGLRSSLISTAEKNACEFREGVVQL